MWPRMHFLDYNNWTAGVTAEEAHDFYIGLSFTGGSRAQKELGHQYNLDFDFFVFVIQLKHINFYKPFNTPT